MRKLFGVVAVSMLAAGSARAQQPPFYSGGGGGIYGESDGLNIMGEPFASSFILNYTSSITAVSFTTTTYLVNKGPGPSTFPDVLHWAFYADNNGLPGAQLATGIADVTGGADGGFPSYSGVEDWKFDVTGVNGDGAARYWVALFTTDADGNGVDSGLRWNDSFDGSWDCTYKCDRQTVPAAILNGDTWDPVGSGYGPYGMQMSFGLDVVPDVDTTAEPSSLALLASGLLGVVPFFRRRHRA